MAENESGIPVKVTDGKSGIPVKIVNPEDVPSVPGGEIGLPINDTDVTVSSTPDFVGNQSELNNSLYSDLTSLTKTDGTGSTMVYVRVEGHPDMTISEAFTLTSEVLPNKLNIVDFNLENANDVDHINADEVIYKDKVTGKFTSFPMFVPDNSEIGTRGGALLEHRLDESISMTRDVPRTIPFAHYGTEAEGINDAFSNGTFSIKVDDNIHIRKINYKVYLKNYSEFTYRIELLNNDEVIDTQELITSNTGDIAFGSWGFNYTSPTGQDEFKLQITEIDGTYPNAEVIIVSGTELSVRTMNLGNYKIDSKYIPQQTYIQMEDNINSFTLTETEQLIYTVDPLNIGQSTVMPRNFNLRFEYTRTGSGIASVSSYLNVIIKQGGVTIYNGSISTQQTGANSHSAVFTNVIKHDYDTNSTLEIYMSYDDGSGSTAPGNLNLNNILGSIVIEPIV